MTIFQNINALVGYGLTTGLISTDDVIFTQNRLLEILRLDGFSDSETSEIPQTKTEELESILLNILDYAVKNGLCENDIVHKDLFDTKIMSCLVARPSEIRSEFQRLYSKNPKLATDWYYKFSQDTDYIRRYRICKDIKWKTQTEYGQIDITINLSKPEKDPKAIAAARNAVQCSYPQCLLCKTNEGYAGRINHAARQNHRIIPLILGGQEWGFQYSPYVYYNEHCIVFNGRHTPMKISRETFVRLFSFIQQFPHYTIGSNADLPIVGGSILSHDHFQGGNYEFAMAKAPLDRNFVVKDFEDVTCGIVKWPMSVIRIESENSNRLIDLADLILEKWRNYSDEKAFIFAKTDGENHNTITPIARKIETKYQLDLVLRNNITTKEHPLGVFHPHAELHHIKKENIGLIEVMGLAVLPSRLKNELSLLNQAILNKKDLYDDELLNKHAKWVYEFLPKYSEEEKNTPEKIQKILQDEVGIVFSKVLEHSGVFKRTKEGQISFDKFTETL